jgi:hypothetical protein
LIEICARAPRGDTTDSLSANYSASARLRTRATIDASTPAAPTMCDGTIDVARDGRDQDFILASRRSFFQRFEIPR